MKDGELASEEAVKVGATDAPGDEDDWECTRTRSKLGGYGLHGGYGQKTDMFTCSINTKGRGQSGMQPKGLRKRYLESHGSKLGG